MVYRIGMNIKLFFMGNDGRIQKPFVFFYNKNA